jgi:uncharacterized phage-associated protein
MREYGFSYGPGGMSMVDSVEFGKLIINRASEIGDPSVKLNETKLHKLIYICDGFMLAGGVNFIGETAKAWNYGPVYPKVHKWLKKSPEVFTSPPRCNKGTTEDASEINAIQLIDRVLGNFGKRTATQLSDWSHSPGSPWELALERSRGIMNSPISKDDMRDYFKGLLGAV